MNGHNYALTALLAIMVGCGGHTSGHHVKQSKHGHHAKHGHHSGAGHHHRHGRFDNPEKWAKVFEAQSRDAWQKPDVVLAKLALPKDAVIAEIGSSTGYWAVRLAKAAPKGKVQAIDIEPNMVKWLNDRAAKEGIGNVKSTLGKMDDPMIQGPVDLVLICNTYHHISDRSAYFRRVLGKLKPGGRLAIIDFRMGELPFGPPERMRVPPAQLVEELGAAGYKVTMREEQLMPYHYLAVFTAK